MLLLVVVVTQAGLWREGTSGAERYFLRML